MTGSGLGVGAEEGRVSPVAGARFADFSFAI